MREASFSASDSEALPSIRRDFSPSLNSAAAASSRSRLFCVREPVVVAGSDILRDGSNRLSGFTPFVFGSRDLQQRP